jgi:flagellar biosynthesis protein FliR
MIRVQGFFMAAPIFSQSVIPPMIKIGISGLFCFWLYDAIFANSTSLILTDPYMLVIGIIHEFFVGYIFGMVLNLIFDAIATFAQMLGMQAGQSSDHVLNPSADTSTSNIALFYGNLSMWAFLSVGGLYQAALILRKSFELIPLASYSFNLNTLALNYPKIFGQVFIIGLKFLLPLLAMMFIIDICVAFLSKILPQASMFFLLMPAKLTVLGAFMILGLSGYWMNIDQYFTEDVFELFDTLLAPRA